MRANRHAGQNNGGCVEWVGHGDDGPSLIRSAIDREAMRMRAVVNVRQVL